MSPPSPPAEHPHRHRMANDAFDFDAAVVAPFRMQPGLRRLAEGARPLHALEPGSPAFADKVEVLTCDAGAALLCIEGFDPMPAWRALAEEAARQCPEAIAIGPDGLAAPRLGWRVGWNGSAPEPAGPAPHAAAGACLQALPGPQRVAGLLSLALHEDFAIVDGAGATLPALAVCLPSHWDPADKVGRSFAEVHGPVADNATLIAASRQLMHLVCQPQRWERFVWTVTNHASHDQHPHRQRHVDWPEDAHEIVAAAVWRTEHQSFVPLPERQLAVFAIHVEVQPLVDAIDSARRAAALHAAIASMSDAVLSYRRLRAPRAALLDWLAARAGLD